MKIMLSTEFKVNWWPAFVAFVLRVALLLLILRWCRRKNSISFFIMTKDSRSICGEKCGKLKINRMWVQQKAPREMGYGLGFEWRCVRSSKILNAYQWWRMSNSSRLRPKPRNCQGSSMKNDLKVDWPMQLCRRCMAHECEMAFN